jgi:hypothetical protein
MASIFCVALHGGAAKYQHVAVPELPDKPSAGGFRPGACNEMGTYMPTEFVVQVSGHETSGISALAAYIDMTRPLHVVGATVLAGWPAFPWGQCGKAWQMLLATSSTHVLKPRF